MIDGQPTGQKQRDNGKEIPIAHIGDDIMVLSVFAVGEVVRFPLASLISGTQSSFIESEQNVDHIVGYGLLLN